MQKVTVSQQKAGTYTVAVRALEKLKNIIGIRLKTNAFSNFSWAGLSTPHNSLISPLLLDVFLPSNNLPNNEETNTSP